MNGFRVAGHPADGWKVVGFLGLFVVAAAACTHTEAVRRDSTITRNIPVGTDKDGHMQYIEETLPSTSANVPGATQRAEVLVGKYRGEFTVHMVEPRTRVSGKDCGFQFLPIPPILPASIVYYGPSLVQVQPSPIKAFEAALEEAPQAHTLIDVQETMTTSHFLLGTVTCINISGIPARYVERDVKD